MSPRPCHSAAPGVSQPTVSPHSHRHPKPSPPPASSFLPEMLGPAGRGFHGWDGADTRPQGHRITLPGASTGGETEARPHSGPPTPSPAPARGHPAVTQEGGREGAGRELALTASPAGATGPAPRGSGQWDETGAPSQMSTHIWHPGEGWKHLKVSQGDPRPVSPSREDGTAPSPPPSPCR